MRSHAAMRKCNECHKPQSQCECECDDHCDNVVNREIVQDDPKFCVEVCGDYEASSDDETIVVFSQADDAGLPTTSEVSLPCPDKLDCSDTITIVAVDGPVNVTGLQNETEGGTGDVTIDAGGQATFRAISPPGSCNDECPFFLVCLCPPLLQSAPVATVSARAGVRRIHRR